MTQITVDPLAVTRDQLVKLVPLSDSQIRTLERERDPDAIPFVRIGRRVLYRLEAVREWLKRHETDPMNPSQKQKSRRANAGKSQNEERD